MNDFGRNNSQFYEITMHSAIAGSKAMICISSSSKAWFSCLLLSSEAVLWPWNQSISNIICWNAGLLGRSSHHLMVQSLFDRLGIKQWVYGLAFEPFKGLINSWILLFLSYIKKYKIIEIMKIIVRVILQKLLKYWTIRRWNDRPSNTVV